MLEKASGAAGAKHQVETKLLIPGSEPLATPPPVKPAEPDLRPATERDDGLVYYGTGPQWRLVNLRELWRHRDLLWTLAVRDLKVRYRQTLIGVAWAVLQPLATSLMFVLLFGLLGRVPATGDVPYGLFVLPGMLIWLLFAGVLTQATGSLVTNQQLIGKVFFPRLILPLAAAAPPLADFLVGVGVLAVVLVYYGFGPPWTAVALPAFVLLGLLAAVASGVWVSALNAIYRDVGFVVPFALQVGFFLSPVVYDTGTLIPGRWRPFLAANPLTGALEGARWALLGQGEFPTDTVLASVAVTAVLLVSGLVYFRRVEGYLADRI
jgi:lipopolysaccharide transport system permease protein